MIRIGPHRTSRPQPNAKAADVPGVLVCINCARVVSFEPDGWTHRDGNKDCPQLAVAWPPPGAEDDDTTHNAA